MLDTFTCAFFGHRDFCAHYKCEKRLENILKELLYNNEYVEFLIGRNGEFDQFVSSTVLRVKRAYCDNNSSLVLILPYATAEYINNQDSFEKYYDEIEISYKASSAHYKAAMQVRNREMVDRADLIICYLERIDGGAYQTVKYAEMQNKK